jgi:NADH:ubiquinone oxidoreductase subunit H
MSVVILKYVMVLCVVVIGSILVVWLDRKDSGKFDKSDR